MTDTADRSLPSWASPEISETHEEALKSLQTYKKKDADKGEPSSSLPSDSLLTFSVIVRFKAVGNAPIMKQIFFKSHLQMGFKL